MIRVEFKQIFGEAKLRSVFCEMDADRSGSISTAELHSVMKSLGYDLPPTKIKSILDKVDKDNDGTVSFEEFRDFFSRVPSASLESIAKEWMNQCPIDVGSDLAPPVVSPDVPWYE